jgi:DNA-binding beta-propeller fold protein YncE
VQNVVIPIDLVSQQAERPIRIPGQVGTHAIVVLPGGRTVLAASGNSIVPIDVSDDRVGTPLDLGSGNTIFGMAFDPQTATLFALVAGGVIPVDTANFTVGSEIPTGLAVSSVYSPHGIVVTDDGVTVYVVGQGAPDFGGRVLPIAAATGVVGTPTSFDYYGIADPAALTDEPDGSLLSVVDSANNWVNPVPLATFLTPPTPVHLPSAGTGGSTYGSGHPTDIVLGPGSTGAFIVEGFDAVLPYEPASETFGRAIPVCSGASSMAVARSP